MFPIFLLGLNLTLFRILLQIFKPIMAYLTILKCLTKLQIETPEAEFKEFEPWLKFKPRLKYGWFHLKVYSIFQDLCRRSIETGF